MCFLGSVGHDKRVLDKLATGVTPSDMSIVSSNCEVLLQTWTTVISKLILEGKQLTIVNRFSYLERYLTKNGSKVVGVYTRTLDWISCVGSLVFHLNTPLHSAAGIRSNDPLSNAKDWKSTSGYLFMWYFFHNVSSLAEFVGWGKSWIW